MFKSENIVTLVAIGYIVEFIVGMNIEYCLWAQVAVLDIYILDYIALFGTGYAGFRKVVYLGRAPRTKRLCPILVKNVGSHEYSSG